MKPRPEQLAYVERVARWWEGLTASRNAGKILGWLMISEPAHQSASELSETLSISTGSVSTHIRQFVDLGMIERVTFPGDRNTYYRLGDHMWPQVVLGEQKRIEDMRRLVDDVDDVLPRERPDRITDLRLIIDFMYQEWPGVVDRMADFMRKESTR